MTLYPNITNITRLKISIVKLIFYVLSTIIELEVTINKQKLISSNAS